MFVDRVRRGCSAVGRCVVLSMLSVVKLAATAVPVVLLPRWIGALGMALLLTVPASRVLAVVTRRLLGQWEDRPLDSPYSPLPALERTENGWYWNGYDFQRSRLIARLQRRLRWLFIDPATWRDVLWLVLDPIVAVLVLTPLALIGGGLYTVALSVVGTDGLPVAWLSHEMPTPVALAAGTAVAVIGVLSAPALLDAYRALTRMALAPSKQALLTRRMGHLFASRVEVLTTQAAELRRIERDLHDGAQARLVAIGMAVSTAEALITSDPEEALKMLAKTRELSGLALQELRTVVHSINPPVLTERGLGDAIRALSMDAPLPVKVHTELSGRLEAAVESAAYFSVAELLTNTAKYADADRAWVEAAYKADTLKITYTDNGQGGADPTQGTGLRGIERRVQAFDGKVELSSPPGGPTRVTLTIPCAPPVPMARS
ncbi:histidine kinase [Streptomyces sp. NPDC001339]|uniref:sensor histidine kinase n=1 Tax=Streptomyces sp. NPDC001339 TaxID=3364563 RepID=UPI003696E632